MSKWIPSVLVCLVLWTPAYAQTLGTITGEVKDCLWRRDSWRHGDGAERRNQCDSDPAK